MRPLALMLALLATGCASYGNMTPEQISAAVKDKKTVCILVPTSQGVARVVVVDEANSNVTITAETCNVKVEKPVKP